MRIRYWSSDVCSSDLVHAVDQRRQRRHRRADRGDHGVAFGQVGDEARIALAEPDQGLALLFHPAHREAALAAIAPGDISQRWKQVVRGNVTDALQVLEQHALLGRSEEHTSELQSLMRISYAVFCLKKKKIYITYEYNTKIYH